ncbi:MAG: caspase family protein [Desulfomonilaceae bacterium]
MAFARKAILVEASRVPGESDLPGARVDVVNFRDYLLSASGGAWETSEIVILNTPSWKELRPNVVTAKQADYVFITFSGHGAHKRNGDLDESELCLKGDDIPVSEWNPGNPRCLFIVDACRTLITEERLLEHAMITKAMKSEAGPVRQAYRNLFDQAVTQAEKGIIWLYSCKVGEAAGESGVSGGYFSSGLIYCCKDWHDKTESGKRSYLGSGNAHSCAAERTTRRVQQQNPVYEGGRRRYHSPMAVKP